jgi:hypothetical protein
MPSERDRLTNLIMKANSPLISLRRAEELADFLLDNGVIVAPMPMANWLREELTEHVYKRCMEEL